MSKIASVHFAELRTQRQGLTFTTPGVALSGDPVIISVPNVTQTERGPYLLSSDKKQRSLHKFPIPDFDIANDIVNEWAHSGLGMNPKCRPGVWVVRDRIPILDDAGNQVLDADGIGSYRSATEDEMRRMFLEDLEQNRACDVEYAKWLIGEANAQAVDPRTIRFIPVKAKLAVEHLGMTTEWMKPGAGSLEMKACMYCQSIIVKKAVICPKCTQCVDPAEFARLKETNERKTEQASLRMREQKAS